ncbi:Hypp5198 [Branchiostoma lanceolatum]|uniref:Hypp5198 protein n=1 Tax=Branchiostoma lanceolatum TaxID=7740 RepID=A0A8K0EYL5_BRALA|nr:Hypp5198 [Branchiostoma lanceolatum]
MNRTSSGNQVLWAVLWTYVCGAVSAFSCPSVYIPNRTIVIEGASCSFWVKEGRWRSEEGRTLALYKQRCNSKTPYVVSISSPSENIFAWTEESYWYLGRRIRLKDCDQHYRASVEEFILRQKSASKVVLQYFIKDRLEKKVLASSGQDRVNDPYLWFKDVNGTVIATAKGISDDTNTTLRKWSICSTGNMKVVFGNSSRSWLALPQNRWMILLALTVKALRDTSRGTDGVVHYNECQAAHWTMVLGVPMFIVTGVVYMVYLGTKCSKSLATNISRRYSTASAIA